MSVTVGAVQGSSALSSAQHLANPVKSAGDGPSLSSMASATLRGLGQMQADFSQGVKGVPGTEKASSGQVVNRTEAATDPATQGVEKAAKIMSEQMETTMRAQEQLVKFVAASSISSSLGRNLNMFLRGQ